MSKQEASKLAVFEGKQIRKTLHADAWWFVIVDVVAVLTDSANPSGYLRDMRRRDPSLAEAFKGGGQFAPPLALEFATAGEPQKLQCWNTEGLFRLIQSIPSPKGELFKRWLSRVGKEPPLKEQAATADYLNAKEHESHLISSTIISEPEVSKLVVFEGKQIRKVLHEGAWWFVITDIISVLTDSADPSEYWKKMRKRDPDLGKALQGGGQFVPPLALEFATAGGPQNLLCWNTEGIFRLIQSIPSPKAEPFKRWLARVGKERLDEIENPELAMARMQELYEKKGYPKEWIDKRLRGIAVRQDLTDEWKNRGARTTLEYAILTNEIMQGAFGLKVEEYKQVKALARENLRDHMTDIELILTMLAEATTTKLHRDRDSNGMIPLKKDAHDGGAVAGRTRKDIEAQSGKPVITGENFKQLPARKAKKVKAIED
jgi:DNA-damage-inducible protein D